MNRSEEARLENEPAGNRWAALLPAIVMVLVLVALGGAAYWMSGAKQREAMDLVRASLRDPDSAKFRGVRQSGSGICGEVNAKNAYGGMVGYEKFFVFLKLGGVSGPAFLEGTAPGTVRAMCGE